MKNLERFLRRVHRMGMEEFNALPQWRKVSIHDEFRRAVRTDGPLYDGISSWLVAGAVLLAAAWLTATIAR